MRGNRASKRWRDRAKDKHGGGRSWAGSAPCEQEMLLCYTLHAYDNVGLHPLMKDVFLLKRLLWNCETQGSEEGIGPRVQVLHLILSPHWLTLSMTLSNSLPFEAQFLHLQIQGIRLDSLYGLSKCCSDLHLLDLIDVCMYLFSNVFLSLIK